MPKHKHRSRVPDGCCDECGRKHDRAKCRVCGHLRMPQHMTHDVCNACLTERMELAIEDRRAEFFDMAMNTLVVRLQKIKSIWKVVVEHTPRGERTRKGMASRHDTQADAEAAFMSVISDAYRTPGWKPVKPYGIAPQLVDVEQVMLDRLLRRDMRE